MAPHKTTQGAALYEAMFVTERAWEAAILALGLVRYSQDATGKDRPELRALYLAKCDAAKSYFDYLSAMRLAA